jgi:disulfide bond formation protein DsbB
MQSFADILNFVLGLLTIIAQVASVAIIVALCSKKFRKGAFARFVSNRAMIIAFIVSVVATLGSLTYSDVIGYEPCKLCWLQRICMYPQALLFGIALWRKDSGIRIYALGLSIVGALIALFHYIGQLGLNPLRLDCLAVGYSASCSKNFVLQFGYITIPLMALSAFILIGLSLHLSRKKERETEIKIL